MKKTFKCINKHKFKSDEEHPKCPTCNENAEPVQWNKVDSFNDGKRKKGNKKEGKFLKSALVETVTAGIIVADEASYYDDEDYSSETDTDNFDDGKGGDTAGSF